MMAIEMIGGVYCPLSPHDPGHRLHSLLQQTESRLVLVHWLTKMKFRDDILSIDIGSIMIANNSNIRIDSLSSVLVTSNSIAYIIFTSGSTGIPKAVSYKLNVESLLYYCLTC